MAFYDIFEQLCNEKGVTPTQVARENGLTQQTVSHWKTRGSTPKAETVKKLADYFRVSVDYLLGKKGTQGEDIESVINEISSGREISKTERRILELVLEMDDSARAALLGYVTRLAEECRSKQAEVDDMTDIDSQLELYRRGMLTGIAAAQSNYSIRPEDVDIDSVTLTPELEAAVEAKLKEQRCILETEQQA